MFNDPDYLSVSPGLYFIGFVFNLTVNLDSPIFSYCDFEYRDSLVAKARAILLFLLVDSFIAFFLGFGSILLISIPSTDW